MISLKFKKEATIAGVSSNLELLLDARISEDHSMRNSFTEFPVEGNFHVADYIRNEPIQLTMEGYVSDSPISYLGGLQSLKPSELETPSLSAYNTFIKLFEKKELVSIQTTLKYYENMAIVDLRFPRNNNTFGALWFNATFQEIKVVKKEGITEENIAENGSGLKDRALTKKILGSQPTRILTSSVLAGTVAKLAAKGGKR